MVNFLTAAGLAAGGAAGTLQQGFQRQAEEERAKRQEALKERQISLQEKTLTSREKESARASASEKLQTFIGSVPGLVTNPAAASFIPTFKQQVLQFAKNNGLSVADANAQFDAAAQGTLTQEQSLGAAEAEAKATQAGKVAAGPVSPPSGPAPSVVSKMQSERAELEAKLASADDDEARVINQQIDELTDRIRSSASFDPRTAGQAAQTAASVLSPAEVRAARASLDTANVAIDELNKTISAFKAAPEAAGVSGEVIETAGGLIQQIPIIGQALLDATGVDPAQVTSVRTNAITLVANLLSAMTGEQSGRFTEPERALTKQALGVLRASASVEQTVSALNTVARAQETAQIRAATSLLTPFGGVRGLLAADGQVDEAKTDQALQALTSAGLSQDGAEDLLIKIFETNKIEF